MMTAIKVYPKVGDAPAVLRVGVDGDRTRWTATSTSQGSLAGHEFDTSAATRRPRGNHIRRRNLRCHESDTTGSDGVLRLGAAVVPDLPPAHRVAEADVAIAELLDAAGGLGLPDAALAYAPRGVAVFPCAPDAKRPLTRHGLLDATTDRGQLVRWWRRWPQAKIGLTTGARVEVVELYRELKALIAEDAARRQATRLRRPAVQ